MCIRDSLYPVNLTFTKTTLRILCKVRISAQKYLITKRFVFRSEGKRFASPARHVGKLLRDIEELGKNFR